MVNAGVGKWRSKYRSGHALNRRLSKGARSSAVQRALNRAEVSNGRGSAVGDARDKADRKGRCRMGICTTDIRRD
jgi:hypothetical protein